MRCAESSAVHVRGYGGLSGKRLNGTIRVFVGLLFSFSPLVAGSARGADGPDPVPPATQATLHVTESVELPVSRARAWKAIRDFNGLHDWHPAIAGTEIIQGKGNVEGTVRVLTTKDGTKLTEELLAYDDGGRTYKYKIITSSLPVTNCVSIIGVGPGKDGGSMVTWYSTFKAKDGTGDADARTAISGFFRTGLDNLKATLK